MNARPRRISYRRPVLLVPEGGEPLRGMAGDLSAGGMMVRSPGQLALGAEVEVCLETHWRDLPVGRARVVRHTWDDASGEAGVGLAFLSFAHPRTRAMLQTHLDPPAAAEAPALAPRPGWWARLVTLFRRRPMAA